MVYNVLLTTLGFNLSERKPVLFLLPFVCNSKASPSPLRIRLLTLRLRSGLIILPLRLGPIPWTLQRILCSSEIIFASEIL